MTLKRSVIYMFLAGFLFSIMNLIVKFMPHIPPFELVFFRSVVAFTVTMALLKQRKINPWGNNKPLLLARGITGTAGLVLFFFTVHNIPLASAYTIQYLSPIWMILLAGLILREKATLGQWLAFGVAFAGVLVIKGFDPRISTLYLVLGLLSSFSTALAYNFIRKLKDHDHPLVVVLYFPLVAMPITGLLSITNWVAPTYTDLGLLVLMALCAQVAQILITKAYQSAQMAQVGHIRYFGVVYALAYGWILFGETFTLPALLGMAMVISGVLLNTKFKKPTWMTKKRKSKTDTLS